MGTPPIDRFRRSAIHIGLLGKEQIEPRRMVNRVRTACRSTERKAGIRKRRQCCDSRHGSMP